MQFATLQMLVKFNQVLTTAVLPVIVKIDQDFSNQVIHRFHEVFSRISHEEANQFPALLFTILAGIDEVLETFEDRFLVTDLYGRRKPASEVLTAFPGASFQEFSHRCSFRA